MANESAARHSICQRSHPHITRQRTILAKTSGRFGKELVRGGAHAFCLAPLLPPTSTCGWNPSSQMSFGVCCPKARLGSGPMLDARRVGSSSYNPYHPQLSSPQSPSSTSTNSKYRDLIPIPVAVLHSTEASRSLRSSLIYISLTSHIPFQRQRSTVQDHSSWQLTAEMAPMAHMRQAQAQRRSRQILLP